MPKDGSKTRTRILKEATILVLENGYAGTSIDQILDRTGISKGAFFYHFKSKGDLAKALMVHFAGNDMDELKETLEFAHQYTDPRERLFMFVQRFIQLFEDMQSPPPGCLYASYIYEPEHFGEDIIALVTDAMIEWRKALVQLMDDAGKVSDISIDYNADSLADMFSVIIEGAFVMSKALNDPALTAEQIKHYRKYLELIFRSPRD